MRRRRWRGREWRLIRGAAGWKPPAWRTAIELLALLSASDGAVGTGEAVARLGAPRSTLNRLCRILARYELIDLSRRGRIALGPGRARSRISTGGPDARGGRAALGAAAQAARPSSRRKLLTDPEPGLLGGRGSDALRGDAASSALDSRTRRWTIRGERRLSIASSTARFAPTTLSHLSRCGTRVSTQRDRLTTSRSF